MADYYGTEAGFAAYCEARDYDVEVGADVASALLVASEYIDGKYTAPFVPVSFKTGERAQVREWPREGVVDRYGYAIGSDEIPREIENATYEAAYRHLLTPGSLVTDFTRSKYNRVSVDGAVSVEYASLSAAELQGQFPQIDMILAPLLQAVRSISGLSGGAQRV